MQNFIPRSIRALMPSAKTVAGALASGALMEVGASLAKDAEIKENVGGALGFVKKVGAELLGLAELPGEEPEATVGAAGPGRIYMAASGDTAKSIVAKYGKAASHPNWFTELSAVNPDIDWSKPLTSGDHVVIPDFWPTMTPGGVPSVSGVATPGASPSTTATASNGKVPLAPRPQRTASPAPAAAAPTNAVPAHAQVPMVPVAGAVEAPPVAASAAPSAVAASVGAAETVKTMCEHQLYDGTPMLAGPGERIEFKRCDDCTEKARGAARYGVGMVLGWAEAWKASTGIDPNVVFGEARPDPDAPAYNGAFGFNDRLFNADLAGWQARAHEAATAAAKAKMLGDAAKPAAAPAAPSAPAAAAPAAAAPAAPKPTPTDAAALALTHQSKRADKKIDAVKAQMDKEPDVAAKAALLKEAERAAEQKHQADTLAQHLAAPAVTDDHKASQAKIVATVSEHVEKGPEVMESIIPSLYAMIRQADSSAVDSQLPWGGPTAALNAEVLKALHVIDDNEEALDFPTAEVSGHVDLSTLPELVVSGAALAAPAVVAPAATPSTSATSTASASTASTASAASAAAPSLGFSMDPMDDLDSSMFDGLEGEHRDMAIGYARGGASEEEAREYTAMLRAMSGNTTENPGACTSGCSVRVSE